MLNVKKANQLKTQASGMLSDATQLHSNATSLATNSQGANALDPQALKQKAGENDTTAGTLRYLARLLYDAAEALRVAVSGNGRTEAQNLATAVGASETTGDKLRAKLKELAAAQAGDLTQKAGDVTTQYGKVSGAFGEVKKQEATYKSANKEPEYKAVEAAWNAFDALYNADLRQLATDLKNATNDSTGLQQALKNLNDTGTTENATEAIKQYNKVAAAYDKVKALAATYQNIEATQTHYASVESQFTELQKDKKLQTEAGELSGKAESLRSVAQSLETELQRALGSAADQATQTAITAAKGKVTKLKDAASKATNDPKGLKELLDDLNKATRLQLVEKAKLVLAKYNEVADKYNAVKNDEETEKKGSELGKVTSAFDALNTDLKGIKAKATEIESKAQALSSTATTQSNSELGNTHETDLKQGNTAQDNLADKANQLKVKAEALHRAANELAQEAAADSDSPLKPLEVDAGTLRDASGNKSSSGNDLYTKAQDLAGNSDEAANTQADAVIQAFEAVDKHYEALMNAAQENKLTNDSKVIAVIKAYHNVKNTYYQMLIIYRIKEKATAFHGAANELKTQAAQAKTGPLGKLQTAANHEMTELVGTAQALKTEAVKLDKANDSKIVENYLEVEKAYKALADKPAFTAALTEPGVSEVTNVKTKFGPLKNSYKNVLRLRVQELATLAQTLSTTASQLSTQVPESTLEALKTEANALADAASKTPSNGLKEKAELLVQAIKGPGSADAQATEVIKQFDRVTKAYEALMTKAKEKGKQDKVQNVEDAYTALKKVYDLILNVTKIKHYATQVETKATQIANGGTTPSEVKALIDTFEKIYNAMPPDIKSIFQSDFESIKNVVCGVHLDKKYMRYFSIFWTV